MSRRVPMADHVVNLAREYQDLPCWHPPIVIIASTIQNGPTPAIDPDAVPAGKGSRKFGVRTPGWASFTPQVAKRTKGDVDCPGVALARGSRESGQALTGAALSGVLLCGGLSRATTIFAPAAAAAVAVAFPLQGLNAATS